MDPVTAIGLAASIVQLVSGMLRVVKYLNDIKHAPKDQATLLRESTSLLALLADLKYRVDEKEPTDPWFTNVQAMGERGGPLDQFREAVDQLARKLKSHSRGGVFSKRILWPLKEGEVNNLLGQIERLKGLVSFALQKDHFKLSLAIKGDLAEVRSYVQETAEGTRALQRVQMGALDKEAEDIITWMSTLDFSAKQSDVFARRQDGTGEELLRADVFKNWLDGTIRTLWCHGLPGAGKTVLVSIIIDYLERSFKQGNVSIAYIYCNYKEQETQTAANLIACLLQQLVRRGPYISHEIVSLYRYYVQKRTRPTLAEWSTLLQSEVRRYLKVFVVIDALDECTESSGTRESFITEIQKLQQNIHLLVTSRHMPTSEQSFKQSGKMEIRASSNDVMRYLESRIERESRLVRHVNRDPELRETIIKSITEKSQGMFLLTQLHMDLLAKKLNRRNLREAIKTLPTELDGIYNEAMQRIEHQDAEEADLAERILCWTSYASRPLTVTEMQHCLATRLGDTNLDKDALPDGDDLVTVCAGLITVDRKSNIIRPVHHTAENYFKRIRATRFSNAQLNMTTVCLTYLSFKVFAEGYCSNDQQMKSRLHEYPFICYAARYWGDHAREISDQTINEVFLKFSENRSKLMSANQVLHLPRYRYPGYSQRFPKDATRLHIAAFFGLEEIVRLLLDHGADVDAKDENGWTALHWAAENGYEMLAQLLLLRGADVNMRAKYGGTALHRAGKNGHDNIVQLLLDSNADAEMEDNYGGTALHRAAGNGREVAVRLLLQTGTNIDRTYNFEATLALLLENNVAFAKSVTENPRSKGFLADESVEWLKEPSTENLYGGTALHEAAKNGHMTVVQFLLGNDAIVDANDSYGGTPLYRAVENGHKVVVQLLLDHGASVNKRCILLPEVRLLLRQCSDSMINEKNGRTPLHEAVEKGHEAIVQLLLERGADISAKDKAGRTPLDEASRRNQKVAQLLLEKASVSKEGRLGDTSR